MRTSVHSVFYDQAEAHEAAGRYEDALALYWQVHRWAPDDPDLWLRMGVLSFLMTDPDWLRRTGKEATHLGDMGAVNAEVYMARAVTLAPDLAIIRFWRGLVRRRLYKDAAGAQAELARAIALNPHLPYAHAELARLALDEDDAPAALASLEAATATLPESARLQYDRGACHARLGQPDAARAAFRTAMSCPALPAPGGSGGVYLAEQFHAEAGAIAGLVTRFYPDILM